MTTARRGGTGNQPQVRYTADGRVQVYWFGEWADANVQPPIVTEDPETGIPCSHSCVYPETCSGYTCSGCGWKCDPEDTYGVPF